MYRSCLAFVAVCVLGSSCHLSHSSPVQYYSTVCCSFAVHCFPIMYAVYSPIFWCFLFLHKTFNLLVRFRILSWQIHLLMLGAGWIAWTFCLHCLWFQLFCALPLEAKDTLSCTLKTTSSLLLTLWCARGRQQACSTQGHQPQHLSREILSLWAFCSDWWV